MSAIASGADRGVEAGTAAVGGLRAGPLESVVGSGRDPGRRRWLGTLLKVGISALLVWLLLRDVAVGAVWGSMTRARVWWVLAAFALYPVGYALSITRWRLLLRGQRVRAPVPFLVQSYMTAVFFSNLLPSTIGGDAIRAYDSWRLGAGKARAASIILIDRLLGFLSLLVLALVGLFAAPEVRNRIPQLQLLLPALLAGLALGSWLFAGAGRRWTLRLADRGAGGLLGRLLDALRSAQEAFDEVGREPGLLARCFGLSLLLQVNVVVFWILLATALGLGVGGLYLAAVIPLTTVLMMIPVTINGIGIRENALAFFLGLVGVAGVDAVALAWTGYGLQLVQAVPGGVVYFFFRR